MNIYILEADANRYQNLGLVDETADWEIIYRCNGLPEAATWQPLRVEVIHDGGQDLLPPSDFPSLFSHLPVFSKRAAKVLEPVLKGNGELLPLDCKEGDYVAFNITKVIDALDLANSEPIYFSNGVKIMDIKRFAFHGDRLAETHIFKLPSTQSKKAFVTDSFVKAVNQAGLVGFDFIRVWPVAQTRGTGH